MIKNDEKYLAYINILKKELLVALGCTEPISIAYCAATAKKVLNNFPHHCEIEICGNMIKNSKSVVVPNTNGLKGINVAIIASLLSDNEDKLQVLSSLTEENKKQIPDLLKRIPIKVICSKSEKKLYMNLTLYDELNNVSVTISDSHTNIVSIKKNNEEIFTSNCYNEVNELNYEYSLLDVKSIVEFADIVDLNYISDELEQQINYNYEIANVGLQNNCGANIGKVLLNSYGNDIKIRAQALAAAASDARMSGLENPVVIISGSGNQGITASVPVIEYAKELNSSHEQLLRALIISDLVTIHQKTGIGKLSAFCGAVCAGCGAASGIAYLKGGSYEVIAHTIVNTLGITSGLVCDGAKPSCAAKIATAIYGGILGYNMYINGQEFLDGDGIILKGVDNTIKNVGRLAREGMKETDEEILKMMTEKKES